MNPKRMKKLRTNAKCLVSLQETMFSVISCPQFWAVFLWLLLLTGVQASKPSPKALALQKNNLKGQPGDGYYVQVEIGTPPQMLNVLIDTGSSNLAVAASSFPHIDAFFNRNVSSTCEDSDSEVYVPYTQGSWRGELVTDVLSLTSLPDVKVRANIALIFEEKEFFVNNSQWQGIMGLGYASIAQPDSSIVPFFDLMVQSDQVEDMFSMQLCGTLYNNDIGDLEMGGSLVLGGILPELYHDQIFYTSIIKEWYYEVVIVDIGVNNKNLKMDCKEYNFGKTIVDCGTTNLRFPMRVHEEVVSRIKSHVENLPIIPSDEFWDGVDPICWDKGFVTYNDFPTLTLTLPTTSKSSTFDLVLSPKQYLRSVGADDNQPIDVDCFKFGIAKSETGTVIGAVVFEGYYVVFDREKKRVGFAPTTCPIREPEMINSTINGPRHFSGNVQDCVYFKAKPESKTLTLVAYIMAGICCVCLVPLLVMVIHWKLRQKGCIRTKNKRNSDTGDLMEDD